MLPDGASVIVATLSNRNGAWEPKNAQAFAALENALDALVHEGAQAVIVFGIPSAARTGYAEERRGARHAGRGQGRTDRFFVVGSGRRLQSVGSQRPLAITQYNDGA